MLIIASSVIRESFLMLIQKLHPFTSFKMIKQTNETKIGINKNTIIIYINEWSILNILKKLRYIAIFITYPNYLGYIAILSVYSKKYILRNIVIHPNLFRIYKKVRTYTNIFYIS